MAGIVLLPVLSAWIGVAPRAHGYARVGSWHAGQITRACFLFAATFGMVVNSVEPMAPLLFVLVSMWIAAGLAVLLVLVWLAGRRAPANA